MNRLRSLLFAAALLHAAGAAAFEPFTVKDIRVEGIQRTDPGTVFGALRLKLGDEMTQERAAAAIRALYATGFFVDVRIEAEGGVLVVTVQERAAIAQVDIIGAREFSADQLRTALRQVGIAEGRIFDQAQVERAEQEIRRQYNNRGRYASEVQTTITPLERNRVAVTFTIDEGPVARIREINIVGNKVFSERELLGLMTQRTPGWMTWYSRLDQYSRERLGADLDTLRAHYQNRGYLEFNIESTQVQISPDRRDIYITINVFEGPRYTVSEIRFVGDLFLPEEELRRLVRLRPGDVFSRQLLTESTRAITNRLGDEGFAFANVNAAPTLDKDKRTAAFTFLVDPGRRVYVRRINISGNSRTRDEVIRREMRQAEGGWFNADAITRSRRRIDRLGFFSEVNVETPAVVGTTDQVDVNVSVTERATGNLLFGAGFASGEGLILQGSLSQNNFLGSGNALAVAINSGRINRVYSVSFTNPFFTQHGTSLGYDVYRRDFNANLLGLGNYQTTTTGGGLRFGVPITEDDRLHLGLTFEDTRISIFGASPLRIQRFVDRFGADSSSLIASAGWARDRRDSRIHTTSGSLQRATAEITMPFADLQFYRLNYTGRFFLPLNPDFTLMLRGDIGMAGGIGDTPLPFFRNFFVGGVQTVRGFAPASIGPRDTDGSFLGGPRMLVGSAELMFPFPGLRNDRSVRLSAFVDGGLVGESFSGGGHARYSAGVAWTWISPFGPLKFSIAHPLNKQVGDRTQRLQFTFGATF
jgi:outer membrane protein insertion porin family